MLLYICLEIASMLYSELLRKVPPTAVYGSTSGCDLQPSREKEGFRGQNEILTEVMMGFVSLLSSYEY
jgi:hypothetical protein